MKKIHMISVLLAMLMPMMVFGHSTHYGEIKVIKQSGEGTVYVATANNATSGKASDTWNCGGSASNDSKTFYIFAKPATGNEFLGWTDNSASDTPANQGTLSNAAYCRKVTPNAQNGTTTYYAHFIETYTVTLDVPEVSDGVASEGFNGYTYSGYGISQTQNSSGGTPIKAYKDKQYTFICALKDTAAYEFVEWRVNGTAAGSSTTLTTTFTADASVKAVLKKKAHYTVNLAVPTLSAGFDSYTVKKGETVVSGLSSGGILTAYYDGTYSFTCNLSDSSMYEFVKWTITDSSGTTESTANPLSKQFTDNATVTAVLNMKAKYRLTLTKPTGVTSYTVTGPTGADGLSNGGTLDFFGTADFTFNCTIDDNYKFLNWAVTDGDGTSAPTTRTLQKRVSSNASVAAVVAPKETYSLTLEKPEGVTSYTVTATPGGTMGSLSAGGTATVREQDSYQFECAINDVEYVFVKWLVTGANGSTIAESEERVYTTTFTSAATVTAVLYKKGVYELTFVKPEQVTSFSITGPNGAVSISEEGKATVYELDEYQITCAFDEDNWEIAKWTITDTSGTTEPTTRTLNNKMFTSDETVTVTLAKIEAFIATCPAVPSGCSYKVRGGTTTSDETVTTADKRVKGTKGQPLTVTLSAASAGSGYLFAGWYIENSDGSRTYISKDSSVTQTFNSHVKIGADFVSSSSSKTALVMKKDGGYGEYDDLSMAFDALEAGDSMYIYNNATIDQGTTNVVYKGTTLTLSSGVTLTVNGALAVAGTVSNSGTIAGSGALIKISYLIDQGDVITPRTADGAECEAMSLTNHGGQKPRYRKTTVSSCSASVNGTISCADKDKIGVMLNGVTVYEIGTSAVALKVSLNTSSAVNEISSILGSVSNTKLTADANWLLLANCSLNGPESASNSGRLNYQKTVDCAGKKLTMGLSRTYSSFGAIFLNGEISFQPGTDFQNAPAAFFGCTSVTIERIKGTTSPKYFFYDCGTERSPATLKFKYVGSSGSGNNDDASTAGYRTAYFYCGYYNYQFKATDDKNTGKSHVYGGFYKYDPSAQGCVPETYNGKELTVDPKNSQGFYKVRVKGADDVSNEAAIVGGSEYPTLGSAIAAAGSGDVITLLARVTIGEAGVEIPATKHLTIVLDGHSITGGRIVNRGGLTITDSSTGACTTIAGLAEGTVESAIENYGTMSLVFGKYKGSIVNKSGALTAYNGLFDATIVKDGGDVVIKGGHFNRNIFTKEALIDLGVAENCEIVVARENGSSVNWFSVCKVPNGTMVSNGTSGYTITPYSLSNPDDFNLLLKCVKTGTTSRTSYSVTEWERLAELLVFYQAFNGHVIDATLLVDREVRGSTLEFNGKVGSYSYPITLQTLAANSTNRLLSAAMVKSGWSAMAYKYFFTHQRGPFQTIGYTATNSSSDNNGTVCLVWIELWDEVRAKDYTSSNKHMITNSLFVVGQKLFTLGAGSNKAMIRPETGAADFYLTLQGAIDFVENNGGGTVMLANDCTEKPHFATAGTYIVDSMGFEHSFSGAEGGYTVAEGLSVTTEPVTSSAAALIPSAVAIKYVVATAATHPADYVVIPSVPVEWEEANGLSGNSSAADIQAVLKQDDTNGNAKWENVVMGQDGATAPAIETSTNGTPEVAEMVVSFNPPSNIGYTVKYAFDKTDSTGNVVANGEGEAQAKPELDLTEVTTAGTPSYFKMRAVLESNDGNHAITTNVPVDKVIGVLKVDSTATNTIIAVPWKSFGDGDVKVSELVHAASLSKDDMLTVYDNEGNSKSWRVTEDGVWAPMTEVKDGQSATTPDPAGFGIARGRGAWLKRSNTSKPIYLLGLPPASDDTVSTTLAPAADGEASWNLLASPNLEAVDITKSDFKDNTGDEIIVPTAGTPKHYTYNDKKGGWGYPGATVETTKTGPGGKPITIISVEHKTDDTTIKPGTGFWYLNKGTGSKTINW